MLRNLTLLLVALVSAPAARAAERIDLVLQPEATVSGVWVKLADLTALDTVRGADPELADRLARIRLAPVPAGVGSLQLKERDIATVIRQASRGRIGKISIADGSNAVRITAQRRPVAASLLAERAVTQFLARCSEVAERCTAAADMSSARSLDVPAGHLALDVLLPPRWLDRPGKVEVKVRAVVDDVVVGAVRIPVTWRAVREAWLLEAAVEPRVALRRKDVRTVRVDSDDMSLDSLAYDPHSRLLRTTEAIDRGAVVAPLGPTLLAEFRAGDEVPVSVALGHVRVIRKGVAAQDGRPGARAFVRFEGADMVSGRVPAADFADGETGRNPK